MKMFSSLSGIRLAFKNWPEHLYGPPCIIFQLSYTVHNILNDYLKFYLWLCDTTINSIIKYCTVLCDSLLLSSLQSVACVQTTEKSCFLLLLHVCPASANVCWVRSVNMLITL